jgi:hypothetical protein
MRRCRPTQYNFLRPDVVYGIEATSWRSYGLGGWRSAAIVLRVQLQYARTDSTRGSVVIRKSIEKSGRKIYSEMARSTLHVQPCSLACLYCDVQICEPFVDPGDGLNTAF